jgi:methylenetetrahydrofolate dehydrogenase (NADP+)/methenyltetrahydrofolate cyclohydrolase
MRISGKVRAQSILSELKSEIQQKYLAPNLAIILATDDPAPHTYVKYKILRAQENDINITVYPFAVEKEQAALELINQLNHDTNTHGIIVQLPVFSTWNKEILINSVSPRKDVDGFLPDSPFTPATAAATFEMLKEFASTENASSVEQFLQHKNIVVLGKGRTAGKPIIKLLSQKGFPPTIIDSKTSHPAKIIKDADLLISAVGKPSIITGSMIKSGSSVIGIGVTKIEKDGVVQTIGDIDEQSIATKAKLYCPTIGGIGPLTIACLLRNVVEAASTDS